MNLLKWDTQFNVWQYDNMLLNFIHLAIVQHKMNINMRVPNMAL